MENNKPIRVLQMVASLDFGGSQNMIVNLYKQIDKSKIQFDFILDHPKVDGLRKTCEELGANIYSMPEFKGYNFFEVKKAWNEFFKEHPEYKIIHSHARSYASIYLPIAKKYGLKTIIHSHNTSNGKGFKAILKDLLQKPLRNKADYLFACSLDAGKWLYGEDVINKDNFYVLNNAIDANKFRYNKKIREEYRKQFNLKDEKVFIQVGAFREQKNYPFTLDLFKEIAKTDKNVKLFIVGNGNLKEWIENKIKEYKLEDNVNILIDRKDVNNLLQMADYFLMPSNFEGLSVAAIEAQASGIMCLLSDKVSKDVKITDNVKFLPLDINEWLKEINTNNYTRKDVYDDVVKAGYDINTTSKWLQGFYLNLVK